MVRFFEEDYQQISILTRSLRSHSDPEDQIDDFDASNADHRLRGRGYAAIDLGPPASKGSSPSGPAQSLLASLTASGSHILPLRPFAFHVPARQAAVLGTAAHLMDWHSRTKFCAACGSKNVSVDAGWKRTCVPVKEGPKCSVHAGIQNFSFPRLVGPEAVFGDGC
jgi:hypothetical protein